ncbi:tetratricopeptide repeat protein [Defluviimonas salinarum]|uniref:TPR repeat n=1 Tax=Defluviimonas salinarum TaxID=2992147 RepID=A0ABT3J5M1_9RHOB|nr:hypothetical protein [Defluviimonas salinarum]MCW3782987.1 hypothetical protein [Defluviimonas salinarum]
MASADIATANYGKLRGAVMSAGGDARDAAEAELIAIANAGDVKAAVILGNAYIERDDLAAAIGILQPAADAGHLPAIQALSRIRRAEDGPFRDEAVALALDEAAYAAGDVFAGSRIAQSLLREEVANHDPVRARTILEDASVAENFPGWMALGDLRAAGIGGAVDGDGAVEAYRMAIASGKPWANIRLARLLRDGAIVEADAAAALSHFEAALSGREDEAEAAAADLVRGHLTGAFGELSSPAEGVALARAGIEAGSGGAALAVLGLPARLDEANPDLASLRPGAVDLVEKAAAVGDTIAARRLFGYWHELSGRSDGAQEEAASVVSRHGDMLDPAQIARHGILGQAASARSRADLDAIAADVADLQGRDFADALMDLRRVNPNAYVRVLQGEMARLGHY